MNAADTIAITHLQGQISRAQLETQADQLAQSLQAQGLRTVATCLDNGPAWVILDLALDRAGLVHLPIPVFFTAAQTQHALQAAGADALIVAPAHAAAWPAWPTQALTVGTEVLTQLRLPGAAVPMPDGTGKITFTSGTTGTPKGVCLSRIGMGAVAQGLVQALGPLGIQRHLCALPLPVLLENIAGLMAPLAHGAECVVLPLSQVGLAGSSSFDPAVFHAAVERYQPDSLILLPQMLRGWTLWLQATGQRAPASLKLVAVGGAAVGAGLVLAARATGIPAYEGYGLSEGSSVQTLNLPGADCPGSAGRPLPHTRLRLDAQGQIHVSGSLMAGYLGQTGATPDEWPTGDLGHVDADGFLHVRGRLRHVLITAFGRNVSPEWVETALQESPLIAQSAVFGDGQPQLCAVIWPRHQQVTDEQIEHAVQCANQQLPDYARVGHWVRARAPFHPGSGMATANGRPQREAIFQHHADHLSLADTAA